MTPVFCYNLSMIYILAAIECEVSSLRHLEGDDLKIILTGIGKVNAAFAVGRLFPAGLTRNDLSNDVIINIGTCGSKDLEGLFLVNKITDEATGRDFYPDIPEGTGLREASLITADNVVTDPDPGCLYEMEASAIFQSASKLISPDRIFFLKLVSDAGDAGSVTEETVTRLVEEHADKISDLIDMIRNRLSGVPGSIDNNDIHDMLFASSTMKIQADELLRFAESLGLDGRQVFIDAGLDEVSSRAQGKEVIARVRSILTHIC